MSYRFALCFASLFACGTGLAPAQTPHPLPQGCSPHVQTLSRGGIDWSEGYIIAEGVGHARGTTNQDRLSAIRAAEVVAVRNALAIASGLPLDGSGTLGAVGNAQVHLRGRVKGHKSVSVDWRPDLNPPECRMTVRVPLWGVEGVGAIVYAAKKQQAGHSQTRRLHLVSPADASEYEILIIDARGLGVSPCLFPAIANPDGSVLYDVATPSGTDQNFTAPVRYVESSLSFKELSAISSEETTTSVTQTHPFTLRDQGITRRLSTRACFSTMSTPPPLTGKTDVRPAPPPAIATPTTRPTSQPTTQPAGKRRRRVVKAIVTPGNNKTRITLSREDAERLRTDPQTSHLLKSGNVVIVTDSVAAGIEGRAPGTVDEGLLAFVND